MKAGPSPGFGASFQQSRAGLGACPLPSLTKLDLFQNQILLLALKEPFPWLCPNQKHVELEDKSPKDEEGRLWVK